MLFGEYEKIKNASASLSVDLTDKVSVEFPGSPPTQWALDYIGLRAINPNEPQENIALAKLSELVDKKALEKIAKHTTFAELQALVRDVLRHYDLFKEVELPNRRRAPKRTSRRRSSNTSEPSNSTSSTTAGASS